MGAAAYLQLLLTHPNEFRILLQFKLFHEFKRDITAKQEHPTSGWDRQSMRRCWEFLDLTSRTFASVVKELEGDLARTICLFYLVLRGLDTIEDDMTIPDHEKQPLLRQFHKHTVTPGWNFTDSGPNEKDRQLLVEYQVVVEEIQMLLPEYREIILDICQKMATGMADFAHKASQEGTIYISTIEEYDLYCHYVAGVVGEGLSRIFSVSKKEAPWLGEQLQLSNSMGLLLQKTNIIRDFREDTDERRFFWPKEIWAGKHGGGFSDMSDLYAPSALPSATWVQSGMILDAMRHFIDSLDYLTLLTNQSVFVFCAIPAAMAVATLELCFMNPEMFQRNIKIRKAEAASLIMRSTNPREVAMIFREYTGRMRRKSVVQDPYFLKINIACGKIDQWVEHHYPSFVVLSAEGPGYTYNERDHRARIFLRDKKLQNELKLLHGVQNGSVKKSAKDISPLPAKDTNTKEVYINLFFAFVVILSICLGVVWTVLRWGGGL